MKGHIVMSQKELGQIEVFNMLVSEKIKQAKAAGLLGLSTRQVRRKLKRFRLEGPASLSHGNRGRKSNNVVDKTELARAIELVKSRYSDFAPTLAHEKLVELHGVSFSVERLRQEMISVGLWKAKKRKHVRCHPMRAPRDREGELVQIDGSPYDWLEGRGGVGMCSLLVFIDDATSKILHLSLAVSENRWSYFRACRQYLETHGKPLAFYCDKHGVFRVNNKQGIAENDTAPQTQFSRAMAELEIEMIYAHSPQAKGRVERANQTLQDRLVKEMRLHGISSIEEANDYLPQFIEVYNKRFAKKPKNSHNAHRELTKQEKERLDEIFSIRETRILSRNLSCQYKNKTYQIISRSKTIAAAMKRQPVTIKQNQQGDISIYYKGKQLKYIVLAKRQKQYSGDSKLLNSQIDQIRQEQKANTIHKPKAGHPWKRFIVTPPKDRYSYRQGSSY